MDEVEQKIEIEMEDLAHPGNVQELAKSRRRVLEIADFLVPGHGKMLKTKG